jgi:hypothetical protein
MSVAGAVLLLAYGDASVHPGQLACMAGQVDSMQVYAATAAGMAP